MSEAWNEFGGASNLIGWRFRACYEEMELYVESWNAYGEKYNFEQMYARERALFGMLTAGVSCVESTCYALHALASHPKLLALPFDENEQRRCKPSRLKEHFLKHDKGHALANKLSLLSDSTDWALWVELRNRMTHRSNLPLITYISSSIADLPPAKALRFAATSSTPAFEADISHLENMFAWLAQSLRSLLVEGRAFAS
ncbi:MAG: hypothetical protein WCB36_14515 [Burkholderiales bacterium]